MFYNLFYNVSLIIIVTLLVSAIVVTVKGFFETLEMHPNDPDEEIPWWAILVYLTIVLFAWYLYYLFIKWFILCLFTFQCF